MAKKLKRDQELSTRQEIRQEVQKVFDDVEKGFTDQQSRANDTKDWWELYNCVLGERQFYSGTAEIFLPLVSDAVDARVTRFTNQLFPQGGRYAEVITHEDDPPHATMSLLEHYVRKAKLRTEVCPALIRNGDVEGQYTVYVDWAEHERTVVRRKTKAAVTEDGVEVEEFGTVEDVEEEVIKDFGPTVEVIYDADLLILPAMANSVDEAISIGGSVTVRRKWTKGQVKAMIKEGVFVKSVGEALMSEMSRRSTGSQQYDPKKEQASAAGIKSGGKVVYGYETWTRIKVDGELRLVRAYYGGDKQILGVKLCPYWCDRAPIISCPVEKIAGVAKGKSQVEKVADVQILANDTINEAADTANFSAMPIIMTDPVKNPKISSMILGLAAIWETNPNDTHFAQFPELWKHGFEIANQCKQQIFQTLGVNPAMMPQSTGAKSGKRNQAEIALEQQVDVMTTADAVTILEEGVFTPLLERFAEYDHQFRDDEITVAMFGELGTGARMEKITDPIQLGAKYSFRWYGVESARTAAQIQQQISLLNVYAKIPPQMYPGYRLNMAPAMVQGIEAAFGPRMAGKVFVSMAKELTVDPVEENHLMEHGFQTPVHPGDDDAAHVRVHMQLLQAGDPHGTIRAHIAQHQQAFAMKAQAAAAQQQQAPGGGGGGGPQPGAQVRRQGPTKQPPGAIHPDQMARAGSPQMPRKE